MRKLFSVVLLLFLVVACGQTDETNEKSQLSLVRTIHPSPMSLEKNTKKELDLIHEIEKEVKSFKEIYDVAVLKGEKDVLVAYKVRHMQRFRMKKIEANLKKVLEDNFPDEHFVVSSDYKIFLEAIRLEEKIKDPNFSKEKAEKRLQKIIKLKNELT